jgi:hypothetical protein
MKKIKLKASICALICWMMITSCDQSSKSDETVMDAFENLDTSKISPTFFPVQSFILGEVEMLKKENKKIIRVDKPKGIADSINVPFTEWENDMKMLFSPVLDSNSLSSYFVENKFLDQSIDAITLTYEPNQSKPDSMPWKNFYVYINPGTQQINRIYLVKKNGAHTIDQITWVPGKFCKRVTLNEDPNCKLNKTEEQMFIWGE